eukprot:jgi/Orpsp1_1/1192530/evm.model.d7180000094014.1
MKYSLIKFLLVGLFSNYVLTSSIYSNEQRTKDEETLNNDEIEELKNKESLDFNEKIEDILDFNESIEDKTNAINSYGNSTNTIDPPYNNKPIQSILIQLSNSDILSVEELDKIAKDLAVIHGLPDPVPIGQLKGYYKFDISGSIQSSLQKRRVKRHIKRFNENTEIVSWVDL